MADEVRISQNVIEVVYTQNDDPTFRVSQLVIEVLRNAPRVIEQTVTMVD